LNDGLTFPFLAEQWSYEAVPDLQWRDRTGVAPVSLLPLRAGSVLGTCRL